MIAPLLAGIAHAPVHVIICNESHSWCILRIAAGPPGRIAMMSSVIAELDMPFQSVYAASKHGLEGLTACLRREVHAYGIQISLIRAGICKTAMWDKVKHVLWSWSNKSKP